AGNLFDLLFNLTQHRGQFGILSLHAGGGRVDHEEHRVLLFESAGNILKIDERANEETSADEQQQRQRDLRDYERFAEWIAQSIEGLAALERSVGFDARRPQRRCGSENECAQSRNTDRES